MNVINLKRNDIKGALTVRFDAVVHNKWTPEDEHILIMLQDDPEDLLDAIAEQDKELDKMLKKALPRLSDDERAERAKSKKPAAGKASAKTLGAGGRVRYSYPGEKGGAKKEPSGKGDAKAKAKQSKKPGKEPGSEEEMPEPGIKDVAPPEPDQAPIAVPSDNPPPPNDPRDAHVDHTPKHTVNIDELCVALGVTRGVLQGVVNRFASNQAMKGREGFVQFMLVHAKEFAEERGLHGDYFGLVYDVLTGAVPEGQSAKDTQPETAKKQPVGKPPASMR